MASGLMVSMALSIASGRESRNSLLDRHMISPGVFRCWGLVSHTESWNSGSGSLARSCASADSRLLMPSSCSVGVEDKVSNALLPTFPRLGLGGRFALSVAANISPILHAAAKRDAGRQFLLQWCGPSRATVKLLKQ